MRTHSEDALAAYLVLKMSILNMTPPHYFRNSFIDLV